MGRVGGEGGGWVVGLSVSFRNFRSFSRMFLYFRFLYGEGEMGLGLSLGGFFYVGGWVGWMIFLSVYDV